MIETKYIEGYEGEGEVLIYYFYNDQKEGMLIWEGYFEFLLLGCYCKDFQIGGLIENYYNHSGFYDNSPWKIENLNVVISELENFNIQKIDIDSHNINNIVLKLKNELISFLRIPILKKKEVFIEYN